MANEQTIFKELGNIYFRYEQNSDKPEVIRIIGIQNSETVKCKIDDGTGRTFKEKLTVIKSNYTPLLSDGLLTFNIVTLGNINDVIIAMYRREDIDQDKEACKPYVVCRQSITDVFYNLLKSDPDAELVGLSVSRKTCPVELEFDMLVTCDSVEHTIAVNIYNTDTLQSILEMIDNKPFDKVLRKLLDDRHEFLLRTVPFTPPVLTKNELDGYCDNLSGLLISNNFMYDVYTTLNIIPLNIEINIIDNRGHLDPIQERQLSNTFKINITNTVAVRYYYDIDLEAIKMNYMLLLDSKDILYVVAYTVDGEYIEEDLSIVDASSHLNRVANILSYYDKYSK